LSPEQCLLKIQEYQKEEPAMSLKNLGDYLIEASRSNIKTKKDNMTLIVVDLESYFGRKPEVKYSKFF